MELHLLDELFLLDDAVSQAHGDIYQIEMLRTIV